MVFRKRREMAKVWARIRETIERHGAAGLVSVIGAAGSVPRETGARIVLHPDGGFFGTIGGGRLEYEAIAAARAALAAGRGQGAVPRLAARAQSRPMLRRHGEDAYRNVRCQRSCGRAAFRGGGESRGVRDGQSRLGDDGRIVRIRCCATRSWRTDGRRRSTALGEKPFHERFGEVTTPVLLFGAGHVGRAVVLALAPLPFTVTLDRQPAGSVSAIRAAERRRRLHRRDRSRIGRSAARRHGHRHDSLAPARLRHHRRSVAAEEPSISSA